LAYSCHIRARHGALDERAVPLVQRPAGTRHGHAFLNDYPCPDPAFHPAPGQSLYDFFLEGAAAFIDTVYFLEVTIDGVPQPDMLRFRFTSDRPRRREIYETHARNRHSLRRTRCTPSG
jgi:hypothetical protein